MRHIIQIGVLVGLALGLAACQKPAEPVVEAAPATVAPEAQTGTVERTGPEEQTGTVERTGPDEQTGTVERTGPDEQTGTVERTGPDEQTGAYSAGRTVITELSTGPDRARAIRSG